MSFKFNPTTGNLDLVDLSPPNKLVYTNEIITILTNTFLESISCLALFLEICSSSERKARNSIDRCTVRVNINCVLPRFFFSFKTDCETDNNGNEAGYGYQAGKKGI